MQPGRGQQQALVGEMPGKELVVVPVTVGGIADDGVKDMLEMAAELVLATGFRLQLHQGVTGCGIAADRIRQFDGGQAAKVGDR